MTRKQLVIFVIVVGVVLVGALLFLLLNKQDSSSKVLYSNVRYPAAVEQNQLLYYNSGQFYKRDLTTNKVERINKDVSTQPNATNVLWSKSGVLFQTQGYDPFSPTSAFMANQKYDVARPYWWYLNFQTGKIVLLGEGQKNQQYSNVLWENNSQSVFVTSFVSGDPNNGNTVSFHAISLDNKESLLNNSISQNYNTIWYGNKTILASYADRLVKVDLTDFFETPVLTNLNASRYTASTDGQLVSYILADDNTEAEASRTEAASLLGELHLYNLTNQDNKILKKGYYGNMAFSQLINSFYIFNSKTDDKMYHTSVLTFTDKNEATNSFDTSTSINSLTLLSTSPFSALITDNQNNLRSVGKSLPSNITANGNANNLDVNTLSQPKANVSYQDNNKQTLTVVGFSQAELNSAYDRLQQKMSEQGFDLATMSTKWVVIPGRQ